MFARRMASRFAPAAAAPLLLYGSADSSAQVSHRFSSNLYRSAVRSFTSSSSSESAAAANTTRKASTSVLPDASKTAAAAAAAPKKSFLAWYETHLEATPVKTKMMTGSVLWGLGDLVAQTVPVMAAGEPLKQYDFARTGRAVAFGFVIHAPASHLHFNFLEWMTVRSGVTGMGIPVFKTIMEQFVYWSWFSNTLYHGCMGAMQGQSLTQVYNHINDVLWDTQKAQWVFWIPIQLLNFKFVPIRHQLNVVLLTSVVWTALLSMWYPPVVEKIEEQVVEVVAASQEGE